jgi:glycosyltransferase involved in cell wall biosynthesis
MIMIFDQFSRYKACSDFLHQTNFNIGDSVLDVGSGPDCLFGQFMQDAKMTYVDPLIPAGSGDGKLTGDINTLELDNKTFDCVTAVDVLEHVPPEYRKGFLERLTSLAKNILILGFPTSDSTDALETDKIIDEQYRNIFGQDYPWLEEHYRYGLPSSKNTIEQLNKLGWYCQTVGHGHAPWLRQLLGVLVCIWDIPNLSGLVQSISEKFNQELYPYDFTPPYYREFIIASRYPLVQLKPPLDVVIDKEIEMTFQGILSEAYNQYFAISLQLLAQNNTNLKPLFKQIEDVSFWGKSLQASLIERDALIEALSQQVGEVSGWGRSLQATLNERDALIEAMSQQVEEVSGWGKSLETTLIERNANIEMLNRQVEEVSGLGKFLQETLNERDALIEKLNQKVEEVSGWGKSLQVTLIERDALIEALSQKVEEVSEWVNSMKTVIDERDSQIEKLNEKLEELVKYNESLQLLIQDSNLRNKTQEEKIAALEVDISNKHAELMKMSDWAYGMMQELNNNQISFSTKLTFPLKNAMSRIRSGLSRSYVGDLIRYIRDAKQYRLNMVSVDTLKVSLNNSDGRLIITFPIITWDFRWQRPQQIVSRLRNQGYSIIYLAMSLSPLNRRFRGAKEAGAILRFNELANDINQVWLHSANPINIYADSIGGDDLHNLVLSLEVLLNELNPKSIHYMLQFPGWWPIVKELKHRLGGYVIFDCMDDHAGFSTNTDQALIIENELIEEADLVITSSDALEERCKLLNINTIQVKNGTEFEHFNNPIKNGLLDHLSDRPIIGYYGAISDWFDMDIVAYCARQQPDWNFVLIGSTFGADMAPVSGLANVYFLGEKPYQELPSYLAYFDICTIPFKVIPLTLATNPVKFYEYMSSGKPVVSIELPELLLYKENCYLAKDQDEFLKQLKIALKYKDDEKLILNRISLAIENSWDSRVECIKESKIFNI